MGKRKGVLRKSPPKSSAKQRQEERRKEKLQTVAIFVGTGLVGLIAIIYIVVSAVTGGGKSETDDENWAAKWAMEDSKNYGGIFVHDGNYETFTAIDGVVREYFRLYQKRDLYKMYNELYANHALSVYGYKYSYESFVDEMDKMADMYHIYSADSNHVTLSYKAITYQDYTNYYLITFNMQYTYKDQSGNIVSTPIMEHIYTVIPYLDEKSEVYYKLLDFNLSDMGMVADRFTKIELEKK